MVMGRQVSEVKTPKYNAMKTRRKSLAKMKAHGKSLKGDAFRDYPTKVIGHLSREDFYESTL